MIRCRVFSRVMTKYNRKNKAKLEGILGFTVKHLQYWTFNFHTAKGGLQWPLVGLVWHLITGCHLYVGWTHAQVPMLRSCPNMTRLQNRT